MKTFYVYELIDPTTSQTFYVGKGSGKRHLHHVADAKREVPYDTNRHKINKIRKILAEGLEPITKIVFETKIESESLVYERELIAKYGRVVDGSGILTNLRDSDSNLSGYTYKATRDYFGEANPFFGKNHTKETKADLRIKLSGENSPRFGKKNGQKQKEAARQFMLKNNPTKKGSANHNAKLNDQIVTNIKIALSSGVGPTELGKRYGISTASVSDIKAGRTWRHIKIPFE